MNFLEYLYCKYYYFQVRVGNADIAPFAAIMIITISTMLYYFSILFIAMLFLPIGWLNDEFFKYFTFLMFFYLIIQMYFSLLHKGKHKKILKKHEKTESNLWAILFPLIAFVILMLTMFLKVLQNKGEL